MKLWRVVFSFLTLCGAAYLAFSRETRKSILNDVMPLPGGNSDSKEYSRFSDYSDRSTKFGNGSDRNNNTDEGNHNVININISGIPGGSSSGTAGEKSATISGEDGEDGRDGEDGFTPYIGENGNWFINGVDTGHPSRGADGINGMAGSGTVVIPTIGSNGNWFINGVDTGKPSRGATGPTGASGRDGYNGADGRDGVCQTCPGATVDIPVTPVTPEVYPDPVVEYTNPNFTLLVGDNCQLVAKGFVGGSGLFQISSKTYDSTVSALADKSNFVDVSAGSNYTFTNVPSGSRSVIIRDKNNPDRVVVRSAQSVCVSNGTTNTGTTNTGTTNTGTTNTGTTNTGTTNTGTTTPTVQPIDFVLSAGNCSASVGSVTGGSGNYEVNQVTYSTAAAALSGVWRDLSGSFALASVPAGTRFMAVRDRLNPSLVTVQSVVVSCASQTQTNQADTGTTIPPQTQFIPPITFGVSHPNPCQVLVQNFAGGGNGVHQIGTTTFASAVDASNNRSFENVSAYKTYNNVPAGTRYIAVRNAAYPATIVVKSIVVSCSNTSNTTTARVTAVSSCLGYPSSWFPLVNGVSNPAVYLYRSMFYLQFNATLSDKNPDSQVFDNLFYSDLVSKGWPVSLTPELLCERYSWQLAHPVVLSNQVSSGRGTSAGLTPVTVEVEKGDGGQWIYSPRSPNPIWFPDGTAPGDN
jgi:hypothetical protein